MHRHMIWDNIFRDLIAGRIARDHPLIYFDIGTRDGFQSDLLALAFAVHAVGFEPEPEEFQRLNAAPDGRWASARYLLNGISANGGAKELYVSRDRIGTSLLKPNIELGRRFNMTQFFEVEKTVTMDTVTLGGAVADAGVDAIDYLKIDIEGAEFAVFQSAPAVLADTLAIKTEACYLPARAGQGLVREIDQVLSESGFQLMDIVHPVHWRRQGHVTHPFVSQTSPPYARGQLIHGDYLYFRDPDTIGDDREKLLKMALIAMALGYFDHALMILERPSINDYLTATYDAPAQYIIDEASSVYGRRAYRQAFWRQITGLVPYLRNMRNALFSGSPATPRQGS